MAVSQALVLYPVNTTTVDSGTGIDIRFLDTATGSADATQTATFTHTNDNVERTFDPGTAGVTNTNNAGTTLFKVGWANRLVQDMTPTDDSASDAFLPAQTITVNLNMNVNQSGGTYASGTFAPTFRASLWTYNPATDTGALIAAGSTTGTTWNVAGVGGDLGTAKSAVVSIAVPDTVFGAVKGTAAEILLLQVGFNTGTVPNPTLGTATFTMTFTVGSTGTKITMPSGLAELTYGTGSSSGSSTVAAAGAPVLPTSGGSAGAASVSGSLLAFQTTIGSSVGAGAATGSGGAVKVGAGTSTGAASAAASAALVVPTVGTVNVASGPTDYPVTTPASITGLITNGGLLQEGATCRLLRDSDEYLAATYTTGADGRYTFTRDLNDPNTYHVEVYVGATLHGLTDRGLVPS